MVRRVGSTRYPGTLGAKKVPCFDGCDDGFAYTGFQLMQACKIGQIADSLHQ